MYSPKIDQNLIPVLYLTAKARAMPMTRLVDRLLYRALAVEPMPQEAFSKFLPYRIAPLQPGTPATALVGNGEELSKILRATLAHPFRDRREIEAWYVTTLQGLCRASELVAEQSGNEMSQSPEQLEFFRLLCGIRQASNCLVAGEALTR